MWCSLGLSALIDYILDDPTELIQTITTTILMERGMKMKVDRIIKIALLILITTMLCFVIALRIRADQFIPKRQGENQIIAYHDINRVELYYHNQGLKAVEIRAELIIDGPYEVARAVVQPGEIVTVIETTSGEPYRYFVSGKR